MNIVAYCRVSTDKSDQINSLHAQEKFFTEYAKKSGDQLVNIYADEGISGTKIKKRKEFLKLMRDAETGMFDKVVVKDISRFARNTVDLLQSIRKLKALSIPTIFLTANMDSMGDSEFVLTVFGALAQEESANTSKRVKFGKKLNAEKGRVPNIVFGYDKTIGDYFNLKVNAEEAKAVRQIFTWYTEDGYGEESISNMLNKKGLLTKRGCKWSQNAVSRILQNRLYIGKIINGKQEVADFLTSRRRETEKDEWLVVDKPELKIIEPEQFSKAQQIRKNRNDSFNLNHTRESNKYLFSTLIKCKYCGYSFRRTVRTYKNTYVRWVCSGHNGHGADNCPNAITIDEEELMNALDEYLTGLLQNRTEIQKSIVSSFTRQYHAYNENVNLAKELDKEIAALNRTRQKYIDLYTDSLITREELNQKIGGMLQQVEKLKSQKRVAECSLSKSDQLEGLIGETYDSLQNFTSVRNMTNAQLKKIIDKIVVDENGNVDIYLHLVRDLGLDETVLVKHDHT